MKLDNQQLMSEFFEIIREEYPDLDYEQLKDVCFGPWRFLKDVMESGSLEPVRLKYFGVFQVHKGRANFLSYRLDKQLEENKLSQEQYDKHKTMINNFLNKDND